MAFQFVNTTADKRKPDDKTRKKIRSQVMKDYRRRIDEEDSGESSSNAAVSSSRPGVARSTSATRRARAQVGRLSRTPSLTGEHATPPREVLGERSTKRGRPGKLQQQQAASLFLQTAHGLFSNFTVDVPSSVKAKEERISPTRDANELARMLDICGKYNEWLVPDRSAAQSQLAPSQDDHSAVAKMQLYALTLMSIGHLSAVGLYKGEEERAHYKAGLLGIANKVLLDPEMAIQDATVGALACLTSYEISFNSSEALTHLNGISRIVEWKGGVDCIGDGPGLPILLQALDLLHAVYFHSDPVFTTRTVHDSSSSGSSRGSIEGAVSPDTAVQRDMDESLRQWQDFLQHSSNVLRDSGSIQAGRACYLAWRLHLFQPQAGATWSEQSRREMDELFDCLMTMPADAFDYYPAVQVRIYLTALATETNIKHKSWYYSQLSKLIFHIDTQHWEELKNLVVGFVETQSYFHRPIQQTVRAMVSGVEIVIEQSLATQLGLQIIQD